MTPAHASPTAQEARSLPTAVGEVLRRHWGFDSLRPLQAESIGATLAGRDSLTVLPTGGGKSLCYQLPPLVTGRVTVVVSPLIALMQDQVAGLRMAGVPAAAIHSNMGEGEAATARSMAASGELRLMLVAPERLLAPGGEFLRFIEKLKPGAIAIDEAHCISQWGHDFRPEYRRLRELRSVLPGVPIAAYTATATPRVREDIVAQLHLQKPAVMVGVFDRPNLTYRILPRIDLAEQTAEAIKRHPGGAAIVYCISRKDTEALAKDLTHAGLKASAYHAGMDGAERSRISQAFRDEKVNIVVATVAFGMGIDRPDVRCVIHAAMPKTVEGYQQETGRAGRDGEPAECLMLYSSGDVVRWKKVMEMGAAEQAVMGEREGPSEHLAAQFALLEEMHKFAGGVRCRHRAISEYFGQEYPKPDCGACDVCLKELEEVQGGHEAAQKIISCVARCGQSFGAAHIVEVLAGANTEKVRQRGHDQLSTYGLLRGWARDRISAAINQLVDSGDLARAAGEFPVIQLTQQSVAVLKNQRTATLLMPKRAIGATAKEKAATRGEPELTAQEAGMFEELRTLRRELAEARSVPPFVICSDATLRELCRVRPGSIESLMWVRGIGSRKAEDIGEDLVRAVRAYARQQGMVLDQKPTAKRPSAPRGSALERPPTAGSQQAAPLFRRGMSVEDVAERLGRAKSTVWEYLADFVAREKPGSIAPWVDDVTEARIAAVIDPKDDGQLRPVFEALKGEVGWDAIRIVVVHQRAMSR